ncbi:hypothetical protein QE152_g18184 [Popillia japonica]|uniref:Uncharacterized protein n=1 Tax=Popillia japonica TaxID=7064 RepID=A0AAW1L4Q3_POPJA
MTILGKPIRYKLELERNMMEQAMSFNYLGALITSDRNANQEVTQQVMTGSRKKHLENNYSKRPQKRRKESLIPTLGEFLN